MEHVWIVTLHGINEQHVFSSKRDAEQSCNSTWKQATNKALAYPDNNTFVFFVDGDTAVATGKRVPLLMRETHF